VWREQKYIQKISVTKPEWMRLLRKPRNGYQDLTYIVCVGRRIGFILLDIGVERWTLADTAINPRVLLKIWALLEELSDWNDCAS
jgi:hypothetical protein